MHLRLYVWLQDSLHFRRISGSFGEDSCKHPQYHYIIVIKIIIISLRWPWSCTVLLVEKRIFWLFWMKKSIVSNWSVLIWYTGHHLERKSATRKMTTSIKSGWLLNSLLSTLSVAQFLVSHGKACLHCSKQWLIIINLKWINWPLSLSLYDPVLCFSLCIPSEIVSFI